MNPIHLYRIGRWCLLRRIPILPGILERLIFLLCNAYVPASAEIGEGTVLAYGGMGVALHPHCRIGRNVLIAQQVTVGGRSGLAAVPVIGDECYIGAGAKILGPVTVGAGSVIGANAVVLGNVPPHSIAAGVPARIVRSGIDIADYRDDFRDAKAERGGERESLRAAGGRGRA